MDLRGGTADLLSVSPPPVSFLGSLQDFLCLASCSTELRECVQQGRFWHNVDLELKVRLLASFRQSAFFGNLVQAWEQGIRTVSCSHSVLHAVSSLGTKLWLHGEGEYMPSLVVPMGNPQSSTRIVYWKSERQTCHRSSMRVRLPWDTNFLVLALRRSDYRSTPESSTCMVLR